MNRLDRALARGTEFLLRSQDDDGAWCDFDLIPGPATGWTTAYVAARLEGLDRLPPSAVEAVELAAQFLRRNRKPGGGWAYNWRCRADADSTALALLFLARRTPPPSLKDAAVLATFQWPTGGFATYRGMQAGHAWGAPHAEVTATALRALSLFLPADHAIMRTGHAWLEGQLSRGDDATYWWTTPAYLALEAARLGLPSPDASIKVEDIFAYALNLERSVILGHDRAKIARAATDLITHQDSDGSWPSAPILRVPDPSAPPGSPWSPGMRAHADARRLFTTATVLSALNAARTGSVAGNRISDDLRARPFVQASAPGVR